MVMLERPPGRWIAVPGWPGMWASDDGQIWQEEVRGIRVRRPGLRTGYSNAKGYRTVVGIQAGKYGPRAGGVGVHVLIATAFYGPRPSEYHVPDHIDHNPANNRADNLEWVTISENKRRAWDFQLGTVERKSHVVCAKYWCYPSSHAVTGECPRYGGFFVAPRRSRALGQP